MNFKISDKLRATLTTADLVEWAGAVAFAAESRLVDAQQEIARLHVLLRELAERTGVAPNHEPDPEHGTPIDGA